MTIKDVEIVAFPERSLKSIRRRQNWPCYEVKLGSLDEKLVQLLGQDARQSSDTLAKQLKVSAATIRRRTRKLLQSGVMRIVAVADPNKIGFPVAVVVAFKVTHDKLESFMKMLASQPNVMWSSVTTGQFDIVTLMRFRSIDELSNFLQCGLANVEGLRNIETFFCLDGGKGYYLPPSCLLI